MESSMEEALVFLENAGRDVAALDAAKARRQSLSQSRLRISKQLSSEEKAVTDEITATTRKRKEEVSGSYDKEMSQAQDRLKKLRIKKEQARNAGIKERIGNETAALREENRSLKEELRTLFKKGRVPRMCRRRWFFLIFMPKGLWDRIMLLAIMLLLLFVCPYLLFMWLSTENPIILSGLHFLFFAVFAGSYLFVSEQVKYKHIDTLRQAARLRQQIEQNEKKIRVIAAGIKKDSSEEYYNLEDYNYDIAKAETEVEEIGKKKQEALQTFEAVTRKVIEDEIREGSQKRIDDLKANLEKTERELADAEEEVRTMGIHVTDEYAGLLGKENLQKENLDAIRRLLENKEASSITEAVSVYRNNKL